MGEDVSTSSDFEHYLNGRAADAVAALRKAVSCIEFVENLMRDAPRAQAIMRDRGRDPSAVRKFLQTLRQTTQHVQDNFELQMLDKGNDCG